MCFLDVSHQQDVAGFSFTISVIPPSFVTSRPFMIAGRAISQYTHVYILYYIYTYPFIHYISIVYPWWGISIISVRLEHMINRHVFCYTHSYFLRLWNWLQTSLPWFLRCGSLPCWQHRSIDARSSVGLHCSRVEAVVELFCLFQYVSLLSMEVVEKS